MVRASSAGAGSVKLQAASAMAWLIAEERVDFDMPPSFQATPSALGLALANAASGARGVCGRGGANHSTEAADCGSRANRRPRRRTEGR